MNKVTPTQWADMLRSGKYVQGRYRMKTVDEDGEKHCCLGVLADMIDPNGWTGTRWHGDEGLLTNGPHVVEWLGMQQAFSGPNDYGETFEHIADLIERTRAGQVAAQ